MKKNYQIYIKTLTNQSETLAYKKLLQEKWDNNVYYSIEHLTHFEKESDSLKYFLFEKDNAPIILMPFVFRKITIGEKKYPYYDVISPYGYNGPLYNDSVSIEDITAFWEHVDRWYRENDVITEFIRFSLNENHISYSGFLVKTLANVRGNLLDNFEDQWNSFHAKVRNNYRKALNYDLSFRIYTKHEITKDIINTFNNIYVATMHRNNADSLYFFSKDYFENLILSNVDNFSIAIAYYKDIPISIELIIDLGETIYAFLGGTNAEYFSYRPNDFLRVKIIEWAIENRKQHYVLGGGMKDGDGLYKNKKTLFPKDNDVMFYTGRKIINQEIYDLLCLSFDCEYTILDKEDISKGFFPFYRSKNN